MRKDPRVFLVHILESIEAMEKHTSGLDKHEFLQSIIVQDAVLRRLEIIGEAVRNLPPAFRARHGGIPWKEIAGTRDMLIHEYFGVDLDLVWSVINQDIPKLKKKVIKILAK